MNGFECTQTAPVQTAMLEPALEIFWRFREDSRQIDLWRTQAGGSDLERLGAGGEIWPCFEQGVYGNGLVPPRPNPSALSAVRLAGIVGISGSAACWKNSAADGILQINLFGG